MSALATHLFFSITYTSDRNFLFHYSAKSYNYIFI